MDVATKAELERLRDEIYSEVMYGHSIPKLKIYIGLLKKLKEKVSPDLFPSNEEIAREPLRIGFQYGKKEFIQALTESLGLPDPSWEIDARNAIFNAIKEKNAEKVREKIEEARKTLAERAAPAANAAAGAGAGGDLATFINQPIAVKAGTLINYAVMTDSPIEILQLLIDAGVDINSVNSLSKTNAVIESLSKPDIFNFFMTKGADLKVKGVGGISMLYMAIGIAPFEVVKKIVEADPALLNDYGPRNGYFPILRAIKYKDKEVVKYLIEKGTRVDKPLFNVSEGEPETVITFAIEEGVKDPKLLEILIKGGADVNVRTGTYGQTPILMSLSRGIRNIEWYKVLVEGGANLAAVSDITGNGVLFLALSMGEIELFKFLLDAGAPMKPQGSQASLLHTAISMSSLELKLELVKLLVEKGADVNEESGGYTPLTLAISVSYKKEIVEFLLDSGADINLPSKSKRTPLNYAISEGNYDAAKLLLEKGANVNADSYEPPLISALWQQRRNGTRGGDFVKLLLDNGVDINKRGQGEGMTPLLFALTYSMNPTVVELLNRGADPNIQSLDGYVPLVLAVQTKLPLDNIRLFLEKGADPSKLQRNPVPGQPALSALDMAMLIKDRPVIDLLLEKGLDMTKFPNIIISAVDYGNPEVLKRIIDLGGNVNVVIAGGQTPLLRAIQMNMSPEIINLLLDGGANVNVVDSKGKSPISEAVNRGMKDLVPRLLESLKDRRDKLFWAVNLNDVDLVKKYLEGETDIDAPFSVFPVSPLWAAVYYNATNVVPMLTEAGADIDLIFRSQTPLMVAAERGNVDMVKLLLEQGADPEIKIKDYAAIDFAKNDQVRSLIQKLSGRKWTGLSVADIQVFKDILKDPKNYAFCPICLQYTSRDTGCMYMSHKCPVEGRHEKLYKLYVEGKYEGNTLTCTICGRICANHAHLAYAPPDATVLPPKAPLTAPADFYTDDCKSQGGGSVPEKIRRLQTLIETACELQSEIGKMDYTEARDRLIEETWKGSQDMSITDEQIQKILTEKDVVPQKCKNTFSDVEKREDAAYPNVKRPADEKALTPIKFEASGPVGAGGGGVECFIHLGTDRPVYRFRHKQPDGSIYEHVGEEICAPDLESAIKGAEFSAKCPINPANCKGYLYPEELVGIMTPEFVNWYRRNFNREMYKVKRERDAAAAAAAPGANAAQQGGARRFKTIMQPMENPQCSFPPKGGKRRTYRALKKGRRRTYKS
jgi:ankyrin repeat protein